ncbi:hypothetical protein D3C81_2056910 [compost metagenome]
MHEALALARAEDDHVGCVGQDLREMRLVQLLETVHFPRPWRCFRHDDQAVVVRLGIDLDAVFVIAGDSLVLLGAAGVEFHGDIGAGRVG